MRRANILEWLLIGLALVGYATVLFWAAACEGRGGKIVRIISRSKDYYDIGMGLGYAADDIVYARTPKDITLKGSLGGIGFAGITANRIVVGFCGRCRLALMTEAYGHPDIKPVGCYEIAHLDRFVGEHGDSLAKNMYFGDPAHPDRGHPLRLDIDREFAVAAEEKYWQRYVPFFREFNVPIFVVANAWDKQTGHYRAVLTLNALLRPYGFARVFGPYLAFQELSMYVGGILNSPSRPVPTVPDEVMAEIKGFDKWSFRKPPRESTP